MNWKLQFSICMYQQDDLQWMRAFDLLASIPWRIGSAQFLSSSDADSCGCGAFSFRLCMSGWPIVMENSSQMDACVDERLTHASSIDCPVNSFCSRMWRKMDVERASAVVGRLHELPNRKALPRRLYHAQRSISGTGITNIWNMRWRRRRKVEMSYMQCSWKKRSFHSPLPIADLTEPNIFLACHGSTHHWVPLFSLVFLDISRIKLMK